MKPHFWIALGIGLFVAVTLAWLALVWKAQWPQAAVWISTAPLVITLATLTRLAPKAFFYAALTLMLYIAFVISQIVVSPQTRLESSLVLASGLIYFAQLKFVLQALNARRRHLDQASS